jgi:hypothetical protein
MGREKRKTGGERGGMVRAIEHWLFLSPIHVLVIKLKMEIESQHHEQQIKIPKQS